MWYNSIMRWILRSPFHGLISKSIMLITYTGRKSGKLYTIPVNYVRDGDVLSITSFRHRTWWRNLRGGAPVTVRVQGQDLKAIGEVVEDDAGVTAGLLAHLQKAPSYARYFQVELDAKGQPESADVARAAKDRVMVRIQLDKPATR